MDLGVRIKMAQRMELHIIYTETEMLLSKKRFSSWHEIQDQYADFRASLGPWEHKAVIEYLADEYSDLMPPAAAQVDELLRTGSPTCVLTFK